MASTNDTEDTVREFVTLFLNRSFAEMARLLTEDSRQSVVESFPEEFREEVKMEVKNTFEAYRRGLHSQYGDPEGIGAVSSG